MRRLQSKYPPPAEPGLSRIGSRLEAAGSHAASIRPFPYRIAQCPPHGTELCFSDIRTSLSGRPVHLPVVCFTSRGLTPLSGTSFRALGGSLFEVSSTDRGSRLPGICQNFFCCPPRQGRGNSLVWLGPFPPWDVKRFLVEATARRPL